MALEGNSTESDAWTKTVERIKDALPGMKAIYKKIALRVLEDPQSVIFSSIQSLSESIGVSEATIVRFTKSIGFHGFSDFKKEIQETIKSQLNPYEKIALRELNSLTKDGQLQKLFQIELENLKKTYHDLNLQSLETIIEDIKQADRVFLCGYGPCANIVQMYEFLYSANLEKNFISITGSVADYMPKLISFKKKDVAIIVTLPPYSIETTQVANFVRSKNGKVYLFTDSPSCPVYALANTTLFCANSSLIFTNSYIGFITIFQAIMNMLLLSNRRAAVKRMKYLNEIEIQGYKDLGQV